MQNFISTKSTFSSFILRVTKSFFLWLDQLKIITVLLLAVQASHEEIQFHPYNKEEIPTRKGKYNTLRINAKSQQLIKHTKIRYSIVSLASRKFLCVIYRNFLNRGNSRLRHSKYLKKYETC